MIIIEESDKQRLIQFITENELDFVINNEGISKFNVVSNDGKAFFFYKYNEQYVIVKFDPAKEKESILSGNPGIMAYEYFNFQNLQQIMEQLSFYDNNLYKNWWQVLDGNNPQSIDMTFDNKNYSEDWFKEFSIDENWGEDIWNGDYKIVTYKEKRPIKVISPHNTLHEVSLFNSYQPEELDNLYFEIHPISLETNNESYLVKILINKESVLKEWINYRVFKKKGVKLFLENLFSNQNQYVQLIDSSSGLK